MADDTSAPVDKAVATDTMAPEASASASASAPASATPAAPPPKRGRPERQHDKNDKNDKKANDWRDWKRRKTDHILDPAVAAKRNPYSQEEIAAESRRPKRKVAVMIGYSGTGYRGMQLNGEDMTIERDLFRAFVAAGAISKANADDPRKSSLARCARTDKGVHAAGNVISLKLIIEDDDVVDKINEALPEQIRVWGMQRTNNSFNCYQYCDSRFYEYLLPTYCLLPPHPQSFLGRKLGEMTKEFGAEEEVGAKMADVKDFWAEVEEKDIKPILDALDEETRTAVLDRAHSEEKAEEKEKEKSEEDREEAEKAKHRKGMTPVDLALRDIKAAYVAAKKRYRISPTRLAMLQEVLDAYMGTRNFHNYTVQKTFGDPSAKRHIKSFIANTTPILIGNTEWISLKVHGQSFMMHQIRKMVGLASLLVRCGTNIERVAQSYSAKKMAIPKAPGLGLLLEKPVFENYNRRATEDLGREQIDFSKYDETVEAFKRKHIYTRIFDVEEKDNSFHAFFNQIDQFRSNHFLWVTAGGLDAASLTGQNKEQEEVDRQLGDEDEDPEGGDG